MTKKKKKIYKGKKLNSQQLTSAVQKLFSRHSKKRYSAKQVIKKLKISNPRPSVQSVLDKLAHKGVLRQVADYKYTLQQKTNNSNSVNTTPTQNSRYQGTVDMTKSGAAYIICDDLKDDVYVSPRKVGVALHGDTVEVRVFYPRGRRRPEGEIMKVTKRAASHFIGTYQDASEKYGIVHCYNHSMDMEVRIDLDKTKNAQHGDKVVVEITKWHKRKNHLPYGEITSVLGQAGSSDIEMKSILVNNGFELEFPKKVLAQADSLPKTISEDEIARRRDMRSVTTFTIDPDNAKDFDDALSLETLENGTIEIGVHIADVTHYVRPNTLLDKEAYKRSTSVYLVDRVLPMLPEVLSNELCSLRPNEDKCTFSAVFTFDKNNKLIGRWFGKTVTHSDRRFTYEEAQAVIESGEGTFADEILTLNRVAKKLRKQKFKNGAIAFEADEVKFRLDEDGTPLEVYVKERKDAHLLIEDFMLLANREVAAFIAQKGKDHEIPFVYRIHDEPNPDRIADFGNFAKELGVKMQVDSPQAIVQSFNNLAKMARQNPALHILEPLAIRTMAKAIYSTENIGHFGLGFDYYTHFTSPIRRYSDVLAHRILEKNLQATSRTNKAKLEDKCRHISAMERKAMDAERESIKYKQVEFIEKHIGEAFEGVISGIIDKGLFVELKDNRCEGLVSFQHFDEGFNVEDSRLKATGKRSGFVYKMGDTIRVIIADADLEKRQIDLRPVLEV